MSTKEKQVRAGSFPTAKQLEKELGRVRYRSQYWSTLMNTIYTLLAVSAVAVLVAVLLLPVLQVYGTSMDPTLENGEYVLSVKNGGFETGDVCAFYYNNKILINRVIAHAGDWVDIDKDGTVFVNGEKLEEPYVTDLALGDCDITLPYQVPESRIFVMGDHRSVSVDSRNKAIGCVAEEQMVGRIVYKVWPLTHFGRVK